MTLLLIYLFIALFVSFLCSIMEAVLLSTPVFYLKSKLEQGVKSAGVMIKQKENIDRPLAAILSVNTIAHTVGAAGVGSQANIVFGEVYFGIVSAVLTLLILLVSEIIPKTLGANYSKELFAISARIIDGMIFLTLPLVAVSSFLTKALSRKGKVMTTSREEISALASIGTEEGVFADKENKILQNLIRLKNIKVLDVMTPRVVVVTADEEMTIREFLMNKEFLHFSRIPVYRTQRELITGYVVRAHVFEKLAEDQLDVKLKEIKREILTFPGSKTLFDAWDEMLVKHEHISLIIDEYGGMDGITTLEDVFESLLGSEIIDETDKVEDMRRLALERWKNKRKKYDLLKG